MTFFRTDLDLNSTQLLKAARNLCVHTCGSGLKFIGFDVRETEC
jgi:hypothetical protein